MTVSWETLFINENSRRKGFCLFSIKHKISYHIVVRSNYIYFQFLEAVFKYLFFVLPKVHTKSTYVNFTTLMVFCKVNFHCRIILFNKLLPRNFSISPFKKYRLKQKGKWKGENGRKWKQRWKEGLDYVWRCINLITTVALI